jgi:hypothetical protein
MKIIIHDLFQDDFKTRTAGEKLRKMIIERIKDSETIDIDFHSMTIASISFIDESLVKLLTVEKIDTTLLEKVTIMNMNKYDSALLKKMLRHEGIFFEFKSI